MLSAIAPLEKPLRIFTFNDPLSIEGQILELGYLLKAFLVGRQLYRDAVKPFRLAI